MTAVSFKNIGAFPRREDSYVCRNRWTARGILAVANEMRSSSLSAVQELQSMGLEVIMLTGDREETATAIAQKAGIQKLSRNITRWQRQQLSRTYGSREKN